MAVHIAGCLKPVHFERREKPVGENNQKNRLWYLDGAMGTMLQSAGLETGRAPEGLNLSNPELITKIHRAYLDAVHK